MTRNLSLAFRGDGGRLLHWLEIGGLPAAVGPERDGWWPLRLPPLPDPDPFVAALSGGVDGPLVLALVDPEADDLELRAYRDGDRLAAIDGPGSEAEAVAAACGRPAVAEALRDAVADRDRPAVQRAAAAARVLGLPDAVLVDGSSDRSVLLHRGDARRAELAATVAGPSWMASLDEWSVLTPEASDDGAAIALAAGLSRSARRREPVLWIWREGEDCGYVLWRRGRPRDSHAWAYGWRFLPGRPGTDRGPVDGQAALRGFGPPVGDAALLAAAVGRPDVAVPLRALLRRREPADTVLGELTVLLALPAPVPDLLGGTSAVSALPGARKRTQMSPWAAGREQARRPPTDAASRARLRARLVVTVVAGLAAAATTGIRIAALVRGGIGVEHVGAIVFSAALTGLLAWTAIRLRRRLRG